jgi:DNA-binding sugar fermentation-stimulating protein
MLLALGRSALLSIHRRSSALSRRHAMSRAAKKRARSDAVEEEAEGNERAPAAPAALAARPAAAAPSISLGRLLPALVIRRPSLTVRTPYVADVVALPENATAAVAAAAAANNPHLLQAHTPAMDCAGLISPGRRVHVAPLAASSSARRTTHSVVLAHDTRSDGAGDAAIVANPGHAERLAAASLRAGAIPELGAARSVLAQQTVSSVGSAAAAASTSSSSRTDFVLERADGSVALVEVKIVVCADYPSPTGRSPPLVPEVPAAAAPKKSPKKAATPVLGVYCSSRAAQAAADDSDQPAYTRTAIFPHGHAKKEVGVVSDRAIKHVHHLEQLLRDGRAMVGGKERRVSSAAVLFVVARGDCAAFRPCHEACPVFARVLRRAAARGVQVLAYDVALDLGGNGGEATMALRRPLPVVLDAMGKEVEDHADLDATIKRVLEFNATDVRTHWKGGGGKAAAAGGAAGSKGKKKATANKKKEKRNDSDDGSDDDDGDDYDETDDDDYGPPKKKKKAAAAKGARRR